MVEHRVGTGSASAAHAWAAAQSTLPPVRTFRRRRSIWDLKALAAYCLLQIPASWLLSVPSSAEQGQTGPPPDLKNPPLVKSSRGKAHVFGLDFNPAYELRVVPVIEGQAADGSDAQQEAPVDACHDTGASAQRRPPPTALTRTVPITHSRLQSRA